MKKENIIACIVFLAVVLFSTPLWVEAESLDDDVKRLELEIKKKELEQKLRKMKESESGGQFAPPPPPGNPLDPNYYNPGQMPQAGGQSQLRGQQGIDDGPYAGMSGQANKATKTVSRDSSAFHYRRTQMVAVSVSGWKQRMNRRLNTASLDQVPLVSQ